jgi:competence protein ComEC
MRATHLPTWKKHPALRPLIFFAAGTVLQWNAGTGIIIPVTAIAASTIGLASFHFLPAKSKFRFQQAQGIVLQILLLATGMAWCWLRDVKHQDAWLGNAPSDAVEIRVTAPPSEKPSSWKLEVEIIAARKGPTWTAASGKAFLYLRKDSSVPIPGYGAKLIIQKKLDQIRSSNNPGAFDYRQWCFFQGITHQAFIRNSEFTVLPGNDGNNIQALLFRSQAWIIKQLQVYVPGDVESGLAEALLIGYKDDLDKELVQSYSRTGVVHIIAISGMHLALIYGLLLGLTWPLRGKKLAMLRLVIVLSGLWSFSLLAGAGPSIIRSAVMFSFLALGSLINRKGNGLNTLLLAALVLLVWNPFWLWDVGFQLSFAAVGGIMLFYRPVYTLWIPRNKIVNYLWQGAAVSLAAQVLTTPLSLYHFHQFPLLFLLANIIAVPLSGLLVYLLLALCAIAPFPFLAHWLGLAIAWLLRMLNAFIRAIDAIPGGNWNGITLTIFQVALLYGLMAAFGTALLKQKPRALKYAAFFLLAFFVARSFSFWEASRQQRLIVYQVPKMAASELQEGRTSWYAGDTLLLNNAALMNRHLVPTHIMYRNKNAATAIPAAFQWNGKHIVHLGLSEALPKPGIQIDADILILSHRPHINPADFFSTAKIGLLVIDSSVPRYLATRWKSACKMAGVTCHDVSSEGAFVIEL